MKVGTLLLIFSDVIQLLKNIGVINSFDEFIATTAEQDMMIAARVELILKAHGVTVPEKVDQVIALVPLVLSLAGVK